MKIDGFLVAMAGVVALALVAPGIGSSDSPVPFGAIAQWGVSLIFFLHGANLSPAALRNGALNWRLHLVVQATTFVLFPLIGLAIYFSVRGFLPAEMALGFFYLCALSSTVASAVTAVSVAGGNIPAAIFNATLSGLIGMVLTPALITLIGAGGAAQIPMADAVRDIALKLLAPFLIGQASRPLLKDLVARYKPLISKLDRGVILLILFTAFCNSTASGLWSSFNVATLAIIAGLVAALLVAVLLATRTASRLLGFDLADEVTAVFCGSQKSLVNGAPIAKILFGSSPALGAILLPLMIYHPLQLIACSWLARRYALKAAAAEPTA